MLLDVVGMSPAHNDFKHHETYKTEIKSHVLNKGRIYYKVGKPKCPAAVITKRKNREGKRENEPTPLRMKEIFTGKGETALYSDA